MMQSDFVHCLLQDRTLTPTPQHVVYAIGPIDVGGFPNHPMIGYHISQHQGSQTAVVLPTCFIYRI